ncbi:MAG: hypothetical protein HC897_09815 [Thermoanaerobaculia bacterium]|nr:hypothetical protein [Thermoanaerobaculia bacterium]
MKRLVLLSTLLLTTLLPFALARPAAAENVEINPFVGWRFGGDFVGGEFDDDFFDLDLDETSSYGLSVGFGLTRNWQLELLWSHQATELTENEFLGPDFPLLDVDVDYYHVGIVYQWTPGQLRPFVAASAGATRFTADEPGVGAKAGFRPPLASGSRAF